MSAQALLTAGRQLAVDAAAFAELASHGIVPAHVTELTTALKAAANDRGNGRAGHILARARIQDLIVTGLRHVRRLEAVIASELANDGPARLLWKQQRCLVQPPVEHATDEAEAMTRPPAPDKEVAA